MHGSRSKIPSKKSSGKVVRREGFNSGVKGLMMCDEIIHIYYEKDKFSVSKMKRGFKC
jgi:hypothetical protein